VQLLPGPDERLLRQFVRLRLVASELPQPATHSTLMPPHQFTECLLVIGSNCSGDEFLITDVHD
jgi:hypothetical protein